MSFKSKKVSKWKPKDIKSWMKTLGNGLNSKDFISEIIETNGFDGESLIDTDATDWNDSIKHKKFYKEFKKALKKYPINEDTSSDSESKNSDNDSGSDSDNDSNNDSNNDSDSDSDNELDSDPRKWSFKDVKTWIDGLKIKGYGITKKELKQLICEDICLNGNDLYDLNNWKEWNDMFDEMNKNMSKLAKYLFKEFNIIKKANKPKKPKKSPKKTKKKNKSTGKKSRKSKKKKKKKKKKKSFILDEELARRLQLEFDDENSNSFFNSNNNNNNNNSSTKPNGMTMQSDYNIKQTYTYKYDFDMNGIVYALGTEFGKESFFNPCILKYINIIMGKIKSDSEALHNIVGRQDTRIIGDSVKWNFILFDFGSVMIKPSHYTLKHYKSWDVECLRNWDFQGSNNGITWFDISNHKNDKHLNGKSKSQTWILPKQKNYFSKFRVKMTNVNDNGNWYLCLGGFEIYGDTKMESEFDRMIGDENPFVYSDVGKKIDVYNPKLKNYETCTIKRVEQGRIHVTFADFTSEYINKDKYDYIQGYKGGFGKYKIELIENQLQIVNNNKQVTQEDQILSELQLLLSLVVLEEVDFYLASENNRLIFIRHLLGYNCKGQTALYDAVCEGVLKLIATKALMMTLGGKIDHKFIHIVITDGLDTCSKMKLFDMKQLFFKMGLELGGLCTTFFVGISLAHNELQQLKQLAVLGGDSCELINDDYNNIAKIFDRILIKMGIVREYGLFGSTNSNVGLITAQDKMMMTFKHQKYCVLFTLDTSGSMAGQRWIKLGNAIRQFCLKLQKTDLFGALLFSNDVRTLMLKGKK